MPELNGFIFHMGSSSLLTDIEIFETSAFPSVFFWWANWASKSLKYAEKLFPSLRAIWRYSSNSSRVKRILVTTSLLIIHILNHTQAVLSIPWYRLELFTLPTQILLFERNEVQSRTSRFSRCNVGITRRILCESCYVSFGLAMKALLAGIIEQKA